MPKQLPRTCRPALPMETLPRTNRALRDHLLPILAASSESPPAVVDARIADLDGSFYQISGGGGDAKLRLSISLPREAAAAATLAPAAVRSALAGCGAESLLAGVSAPEGGGQVHVDLALRESAGCGEPEAVAAALAQLRAKIMAAPIAQELAAMAGGGDEEDGAVLPVPFREDGASGEALCVFIKRKQGSLTAVLPVRFADGGDATIAAYFLQTFPETKRNFGGAPVVNFSRAAPLELKDVGRGGADANCGYVSVVVFPTHCESEAQREEAAWRLLSLHAFIAFHIKASKASMHESMRKQANSALRQLSDASLPAFSAQPHVT